jgi:hypothetical protein
MATVQRASGHCRIYSSTSRVQRAPGASPKTVASAGGLARSELSPVLIAVGTPITGRPPHNAVRAAFQHQMWPATFDAASPIAGSSAKRWRCSKNSVAPLRSPTVPPSTPSAEPSFGTASEPDRSARYQIRRRARARRQCFGDMEVSTSAPSEFRWRPATRLLPVVWVSRNHRYGPFVAAIRFAIALSTKLQFRSCFEAK